jgi:hypothetical protein
MSNRRDPYTTKDTKEHEVNGRSMNFTLRVLIAVALGSPSIAFAQAHSQNNSKPDVSKRLTVMGFTLADVQAKLGKSVAKKCSRDEEESMEVCYMTGGKGHTKVVFEAGFSGGWKELDGYKVIGGSLARPCYRQCPRASQVTSDVQTKGGLKLGLNRGQLIALLGPPKQTSGNKLTFQWQSRQPMTKEQNEHESKTFKSPVTDAYYDVQDTICVILADSKVVEFEVHHIVTY